MQSAARPLWPRLGTHHELRGQCKAEPMHNLNLDPGQYCFTHLVVVVVRLTGAWFSLGGRHKQCPAGMQPNGLLHPWLCQELNSALPVGMRLVLFHPWSAAEQCIPCRDLVDYRTLNTVCHVGTHSLLEMALFEPVINLLLPVTHGAGNGQ